MDKYKVTFISPLLTSNSTVYKHIQLIIPFYTTTTIFFHFSLSRLIVYKMQYHRMPSELPVPEGWYHPNPELDPSFCLPLPRFVTSTTQAALDEKKDFVAAKAISSHKVAYTQYGDAIYNEQHKVLFTVHGLTGDGANFHYLSKYLQSKGYCVINIDIVGRGASDDLKSAKDYTYTQYCIDIMCVLNEIVNNIVGTSTDDYCKNNKYYWLGTSMGGLLGMVLPTIYKQYCDLLFTKPMVDLKTNPEQGLFSGVILNDIGPSVQYAGVQAIEAYVSRPVYFNTRDEAADYYFNIYTAGFGPFVDRQFFLHRALVSLRTVEITPEGEDQPKTVFTVRYDRAGILNGVHDMTLPDLDIFRDINQDKKETLLKYGKPYDPTNPEHVVTQRDEALDEFFNKITTDNPEQIPEYWYSFWSYFNTLNCPVLLYHGETSTLLNDTQAQQMKMCHIEKNKQQWSYIKWSATGHVPPLYTEAEFVPIEQHLEKY